MSLWISTGFETWIACGSVASLILPQGRIIILGRDDDRQHSPADKAVIRSLEIWRKAGINILFATPWPDRRFDKTDFNDLIISDGIEAVRARIAEVLNPPPPPDDRKTVGQAREIIDKAAISFFNTALGWDPASEEQPICHAARVDVGAGKSKAMRDRGIEMLDASRKMNDMRPIMFVVPQHALGIEASAEFEKAAKYKLKAGIWRGREADDPNAPGQLMCRDLDRVNDAREAGADVETGCCKSNKLLDGSSAANNPAASQCPSYDICGYQAQKNQTPDCWFGAHELLLHQRVSAIKEPAALIIDESMWQAALDGASGNHITLTVDTLAEACGLEGSDGARLDFLRATVLSVLRSINESETLIARAALLNAGLTAANATEAIKLEWLRKVEALLQALVHE